MSKIKVGTYFLGRVVKYGVLDNEKLVEAITKGSKVSSRSYNWLITNVKHVKKTNIEYVFGNLSKYTPEGETVIVDEGTRRTHDDHTENLALASVPFVYLPKYSGICYLRLWNQIDINSFKGRVGDIIENYFSNFFVGVEINDISENYAFLKKAKKFSTINKIDCSIQQPNPLYGDIWKHLKEYLISRNSKELSISEESKDQYGIVTNLNGGHSDIELSLTDAAIRMALAGYGKGSVTGILDGVPETIKTKDDVIKIKFPKEPDPEELALEAQKNFMRINKVRGLKH
ncbi:conserved hypothetical protein [Halobacteriovorax marinus SJ]|uniref:Uncharacterized protein n=1 Tax=Halobacteriovorax marinus (strain ATCC BAA-682 / DSM 15412 / SJ) TaxID=862908 RepID=E1X5X0_HALMS|nr:hypothetical protein [Halobacteriovorax marinus]CBW25687.1 conserved hypothetical protein [Halobacteriovorax marinus SJ]